MRDLVRKSKRVFQKNQLKKGPCIVAIGGGTGLPVLLRGLKEYTSNITAIVCVTDDGGSSGYLRGQFGILPPGDLRNCLVALADAESIMEKIFDYRFKEGEGLAGHSLGNLLITAMAELAGNFEKAIYELSKVLAIRGQVLPSTLANTTLAAELIDGSLVKGESNISKTKKPISRVYSVPADCEALPQALEAILAADAVILGPGSLYTSVIPNLLVPGIVEAIQKSQGQKTYICNVMTEPGETTGYTAGDHLRAIYNHAAPSLVDTVIVNSGEIPRSYRDKYAQEGAEAVETDEEALKQLGVQIIAAPLIREDEYIRHNPATLAQTVIKMLRSV